MRRLAPALLLALVLLPFSPSASAKARAKTTSSKSKAKTKRVRSASAKRAFERTHPCPSTGRTSGTCPGYVIDHVIPLKRGGADSPANMQWQTIAAAKAKDRIE